MPTKRRKIGARRRPDAAVPAWVPRYLADGTEPPDDGCLARDQFLAWYFDGAVFGDPNVPGLPDPRSEAARELRERR